LNLFRRGCPQLYQRGSRLHYVASSQGTGAEGSVAVACGRIPASDRVTVGRLLAALDAVVMWDTWNAWQPASSDKAGGR